MLKVKLILDDVVSYTYKESSKLDAYKKFYVEIIDKKMNSFHGDYNSATHHIRIFNLYRDDSAIIATTIHELAHHIDNCNRGTTNHDKEFYMVFRELLYTALNMRIFDKVEFHQATKDASDRKKIDKMLAEYEPVPIEYKRDCFIIEVTECYHVKDVLKAAQYSWNKINSTWEKEVPVTKLEEEKQFLSELNVVINVVDATKVSFRKKNYIVAGEGSYDFKEQLKADGFRFDRKFKVWKKEGGRLELEEMKSKYPGVQLFVL